MNFFFILTHLVLIREIYSQTVVNADDKYYEGCVLKNLFSVSQCSPTITISKGSDYHAPLDDESACYSPLFESADVNIPPLGGIVPFTTTLNYLASNGLHSLLISYKGKLIKEEYYNGQNKDSLHFHFSSTKSLLGLVAANLVAEGLLDLNKTVGDTVEDLKDTVFGDVTIEMLLNMSNEYIFSEEATTDDGSCIVNTFTENLEKSKSDFEIPEGCEFMGAYNIADGFSPPTDQYREDRAKNAMNKQLTDLNPLSNYPGPLNKRELIDHMKRGTDAHGTKFTYRTLNVDVTAMVIDAVLAPQDQTAQDYFQNNIWTKLGADHDMTLTVDGEGYPNWGRGASASSRDMLRVGNMILNEGKNDKGEQIIHPNALNYIFDGTDTSRDQYKNSSEKFGMLTPGYEDKWSYRAFFRSFNPIGGTGTGQIAVIVGFWGQYVYIDRTADLVIVMNAKSGLSDYFPVLLISLSFQVFRELDDDDCPKMETYDDDMENSIRKNDDCASCKKQKSSKKKKKKSIRRG